MRENPQILQGCSPLGVNTVQDDTQKLRKNACVEGGHRNLVRGCMIEVTRGKKILETTEGKSGFTRVIRVK